MHNPTHQLILDAADLVTVVSERIRLTPRGKEFVGLCPFHADKTPSLYVNNEKRIFKCFACGAGGDAIGFVRKFDHLEYHEAIQALAERFGVDVHRTAGDRAAADRRRTSLSVNDWAVRCFQRCLHERVEPHANDYAARRGLSSETLDRFRIGAAPNRWDFLIQAARRDGLSIEQLRDAGVVVVKDDGRTFDIFRNRLMFPIADAQGRVVAFGGRALSDGDVKYLNTHETGLFSKGRTLFGFDLARREIDACGTAIVVEGYMDAVMLHQAGVANAVATLGTALTDAQVRLLRGPARTIIMCFDSDEAGVKAADRGVEIAIGSDVAVRVVMLRDKDPADCVLAGGAEAFAAEVERAVDALEFKWSRMRREFGGGPTARRAALDAFIQFAARAASKGGLDPMGQALLVGRLTELLGGPAEEVFDLLRQARHSQMKRPVRAEDRGADVLIDGEQAMPASLDPLVAPVETLLGLLMLHPGCWRLLDDTATEAFACYETWSTLHNVLLDVHDMLGEYSLADVVARCDAADVCQLVGRARERAALIADPAEAFVDALALLAPRMHERKAGMAEPADCGGDAARQAYLDAMAAARARNRRREAGAEWSPGAAAGP